jgi:hypothetical protein
MHGSTRKIKKKPPKGKQNIPLRKKELSLKVIENTEYLNICIVTFH